MIFPVIECERLVQMGDKTRISGMKSFVTKGESQIDKVEICPDFVSSSSSQDFVYQYPARFSSTEAVISNVQGDISQVPVGSRVFSSHYSAGVYAIVQSVDADNHILNVDIPAFDDGDDQATIKGTIQTSVDPVFINVSGQGPRDYFLDYVYNEQASRDVVTAVRVTVGQASQVATKSLRILIPTDDVLFSTDDDLMALEPELTKYVPAGKSSFINVHREAKNKILESLSDYGIRNDDGTPLDVSVLTDVNEVRTWSRDLTLSLIFQGMSNEAGDVFQAKAKFYSDQANTRADRAYLTLSIPVNDSDKPFRAGQVQVMSLSR